MLRVRHEAYRGRVKEAMAVKDDHDMLTRQTVRFYANGKFSADRV